MYVTRELQKVWSICKQIQKQTGERRLINATRLWNAIDNLKRPEDCWAFQAFLLPDCFDDPTDVNTIRFTYVGEN